MPVFNNSKNIKEIYYNSKKIKEAYYNRILVYQENVVIDPEYNYFVFDTSKLQAGKREVKLIVNMAGDQTEWDRLTDWGDGTIDNKTSHTYPTHDIYTVKTKWMLNNSGGSQGSSTDSKDALIACYNINKNITNASFLFSSCPLLKKVDLSNFDTSNVTNMSYMFSYCNSLTSLDLSNFDTSNVTDFNYMFDGCRNLSYLDISNFNLDNRKYNYSSMFSETTSLTLDNVIMTNCSQETKDKITEAFYVYHRDQEVN